MWDAIVGTQVPADTAMLWALGGPSVVLRTAQTTILVDPFLGHGVKQGWERAIPIPFPAEAIHSVDAVLSSHHHIDHCHETTLRPIIERTDALLYGARSSAQKWEAWGFPTSRYAALVPGDTRTIGDIRLRTHQAVDWEDTTALAFVFDAYDRSIYYGGDTLYFDGLADAAPVDWALLSYAKNLPEHPAKLYMDDDDVKRSIEALQANQTLVMHWDLWVDPYLDPTPLVRRLAASGITARTLHQGDHIILT